MLTYYKHQSCSLDINYIWTYSNKIKTLLSSLLTSSNYLVKLNWISPYLINFKYLYTRTTNLLLSEVSKISSLTQVNPKPVDSEKGYIYLTIKSSYSGNNHKLSSINPSRSNFNSLYYFKNKRFKNIFKWLLFNIVYLNISLWNFLLNTYKKRQFKFYSDFSMINLVNYEYFRINYLR